MKQNHLAELVAVILGELDKRPEVPPSESRMRNWLSAQGYAKRDIDKAMDVVRLRISSAAPAPASSEAPAAQRSGSMRHLHPLEEYKLSPDARAALTRLDAYELMDAQEREMLMDRILQQEGEVSMEDLDYLVGWILCSTRDVESQQTIADVLQGAQKEHWN
jgi:uncharacterized protein Smg (DUF494 family)